MNPDGVILENRSAPSRADKRSEVSCAASEVVVQFQTAAVGVLVRRGTKKYSEETDPPWCLDWVDTIRSDTGSCVQWIRFPGKASRRYEVRSGDRWAGERRIGPRGKWIVNDDEISSLYKRRSPLRCCAVGMFR